MLGDFDERSDDAADETGVLSDEGVGDLLGGVLLSRVGVFNSDFFKMVGGGTVFSTFSGTLTSRDCNFALVSFFGSAAVVTASFLMPNRGAGFSALLAGVAAVASSFFDSFAAARRADQGRETVGDGVVDESDVDVVVGASFIHEGFETVVIRP